MLSPGEGAAEGRSGPLSNLASAALTGAPSAASGAPLCPPPTQAASFAPVILTQTYVTTALLTLAITLLSPLHSFRDLRRLNLAAAVKEIGG